MNNRKTRYIRDCITIYKQCAKDYIERVRKPSNTSMMHFKEAEDQRESKIHSGEYLEYTIH